MANSRNDAVKPLPFPGESPTVALALAAGQRYGLHEEEAKPARSKPKRKASAKKARKAAKPARKPAVKKAKPVRKAGTRRKGTAGTRTR